MKTENFHFTQQQQNIIGHALRKYALTAMSDNGSPALFGISNLSALLEDFLERDQFITDMNQGTISQHAWTVRMLRELLQEVFDPRVLPALQSATPDVPTKAA